MTEIALQIAKMTGIHRCTGLGQTKFVEKGQELPPCSCPNGNCKWQFIKEDNVSPKDSEVIFIGQGILHTIETDELPDVGSILNLISGWENSPLQGKYRVTKLDTIKWQNEEYFHVSVEKIGDITDDIPINVARPMNC